jgi:hypothetical protein
VNPTGRYLCAGVLVKAADDKPNLLRWDLTTPDKPALGVSRTGDHDIRALAVAPDGTVFPVGGIPGTAPAPREYDPATGAVTNRGDPQVRMKSHAGHPPKITIGAPLLLSGPKITSEHQPGRWVEVASMGSKRTVRPRLLASLIMRRMARSGSRRVKWSAPRPRRRRWQACVLSVGKTVANNVSAILAKLHLTRRSQAIVRARDAGLGRPR